MRLPIPILLALDVHVSYMRTHEQKTLKRNSYLGNRSLTGADGTQENVLFSRELTPCLRATAGGDHAMQLAAISVDTRNFTVTQIPADGERKEVSLPIIDDSRPTGYWLPRSVFQKLLYSEVRRTPFFTYFTA